MPATARPNILLILTDQQRFDSLGCYGCEAVRTPHLDRLAADGVLFGHCVAVNPVCTPSRASLWTGRDLPEHGVRRLYDNLADDEILFPEYLRQAGYRTGLFGKLHVSSMHEEAARRHPHDGFDVYEWTNEATVRMDSPYHAYSRWLRDRDPALRARMAAEGRAVKDIPRHLHFTHWAAERTLAFIDESAGAPWFACMSVFDPHNPYDCGPREYFDRVDPARIPPPPPPNGEPRPRAHRREARDGYLGDVRDFSAADLAEMRRGYCSMVDLLDEEVGRVVESLRASGRLDDTLIVFSSDHGDMLGDHGLLVKGAFFFDPCVRVPLIMHWPRGLPGGRRAASPVQNHDVAATVLAAAGVESPNGRCLSSRNLLPLARGEVNAVRKHVLCRYRNTGLGNGAPGGTPYWHDPEIHATMLRTDRWKLCVYHGTSDGELYDLANDPDETANRWNALGLQGIQTGLRAVLEEELRGEDIYARSPGGETLPSVAVKLPDNRLK